MIKIPTLVNSDPGTQNSLILDGRSAIEKCVQNKAEKSILHLEEHVLLFILEGNIILTHGKDTYTVGKGELTLLKKATTVHYEKQGNPDLGNRYHGMIVVLNSDLLKTFLVSTEKIVPKETNGEVRPGVHIMTECLVSFTDSLQPYFKDNSGVHPGQLQLKITDCPKNHCLKRLKN